METIDKILDFLSLYSSLITAFATIAIAFFSAFTWRVSKRIHEATTKRDEEMRELLENLTAATLVTPTGLEREEIIVRSFKDMLNNLKKLK